MKAMPGIYGEYTEYKMPDLVPEIAYAPSDFRTRSTAPHRCPVCIGKGIVPAGFYLSTSGQWLTANCGPETCKSCTGKGYILV